jgi:hypothetical protein
VLLPSGFPLREALAQVSDQLLHWPDVASRNLGSDGIARALRKFLHARERHFLEGEQVPVEAQPMINFSLIGRLWIVGFLWGANDELF